MFANVLKNPHAMTADAVVEALGTTRLGITSIEAMLRFERYGANVLPRAEPPGMVRVFFNQFISP